MKSSSIELVPENLLASHKRKLYAEDKITAEELELVKKIKDKVLERWRGHIIPNHISFESVDDSCSRTKFPINTIII